MNVTRRLPLLAGLTAIVLASCGDDGASSPAVSPSAPATSSPAVSTSLPSASSAATAPDTTAPAGGPVIDPGDGGNYRPEVDPANFVETVDNPYFPLAPGTRWVYQGESDGEVERIEVVVTEERRDIQRISAVVVRDTVSIGGEMVEDTFDWFAQDREGNVWYLGEDTHEFEDGVEVSTEGSWEHGTDGALAGIVMPADPAAGDAYRQEYYVGEAEDMGEIIEVGARKTIGLGVYEDVVVTEDWTPLEPDVVENKWYAPGVGNIYEIHTEGPPGSVELVEFTPGR
jgi:hypothetical protein